LRVTNTSGLFGTARRSVTRPINRLRASSPPAPATRLPATPARQQTVTLLGYAAVHGLPYLHHGGRERTAAGCLPQLVRSGRGGGLGLDHQFVRRLGSTRTGELTLRDDGFGLLCTMRLDPDRPFAREAIASVRSGARAGMSYHRPQHLSAPALLDGHSSTVQ